jgi:nucleotide-binding universal stress UspA family protein
MKNILVPIDFSDNAEIVIAAAKEICRHTGAKMTLLHVSQPYIPDISMPLAGSTLGMYEEMNQEHDLRLMEFVDALHKEGLDANSRRELGPIPGVVLDIATEMSAELIVVGRTGSGTFLDKLFGSNATLIALDAKCPVLVIPHGSDSFTFNKMLYATQLEYEEVPVLKEIKKLAAALKAELNFVKINGGDQPNIHVDQDYIDDITDTFGIGNHEIVIKQAPTVIEGLVAYYEKIEANLLVVASRPRGLLEQYLTNPSMTKKLVLNTQHPILVYHLRKQ